MWSDEEVSRLKRMYESTPNDVIADKLDRTVPSIQSKASTLGLMKNRRLSRTYSTRNSSTRFPTEDDEFANYICGFVDGEGSFNYNSETGSFRFAIELVEDDREILKEIQRYLDVGKIYDVASKHEHWRDKTQYVVYDADSLARTVIPFFEYYQLRAPERRAQLDEFVDEFYQYYDLNRKV